jgi:hypothetical protein
VPHRGAELVVWRGIERLAPPAQQKPRIASALTLK